MIGALFPSALLCCAVALVVVGCAASSAAGVAKADSESPRRTVIGRTAEGAPLTIMTHGDGPRTVLFLASIHGDETAGTTLLERLGAELKARPSATAGCRVILFATANPDGVAHRTRENAHGVDLNRNFPAPNWRSSGDGGAAALSEPESRALHDLVRAERPALIVSFHQPLACLDFDGPAVDVAREMSRHTALKIKRLGGRPGSLGSWAGAMLAVPVVTVELPRAADAATSDASWRRYGPMLLAAIEATGRDSP